MIFINSRVTLALALTVAGPASAELCGPRFFRAADLSAAERLLGPLDLVRRAAIEDAHLAGADESGRDGVRPGAINNYTRAQIKRKAVILKSAGFDRAEIRLLMEQGIVGVFDEIFGAYVPSEIREEWRAEDRRREAARATRPPQRRGLWRSLTTGVADAVITVFGPYAPRGSLDQKLSERRRFDTEM